MTNEWHEGPYLNYKAHIDYSKSSDLPHWFQQQKMQFVTFRLADSLPQVKLRRWKNEKEVWLLTHPQPWDEETQREYNVKFSNEIEKWSDAGYGACLLAQGNAADAVAQALDYHDNVRYRLISYVVMPNHVHVLFIPHEEFSVSRIVHLWKSYSARTINAQLQRTGKVWQREYFDTMIRNREHCQHVLNYIGRNYAHGGLRFLPVSWSGGLQTADRQ